MKLKSGFEKRRARVEMLPIIDVVFLLLVFFIYAFLSMVMHRGLDVELPGVNASSVSQQEYVDITLTADNELFVNKQPATLESAPAAVHAALAGRDLPVFINGDHQAELGLAIQLLDHLRFEGIKKVSFACTEHKN